MSGNQDAAGRLLASIDAIHEIVSAGRLPGEEQWLEYREALRGAMRPESIRGTYLDRPSEPDIAYLTQRSLWERRARGIAMQSAIERMPLATSTSKLLALLVCKQYDLDPQPIIDRIKQHYVPGDKTGN